MQGHLDDLFTNQDDVKDHSVMAGRGTILVVSSALLECLLVVAAQCPQTFREVLENQHQTRIIQARRNDSVENGRAAVPTAPVGVPPTGSRTWMTT